MTASPVFFIGFNTSKCQMSGVFIVNVNFSKVLGIYYVCHILLNILNVYFDSGFLGVF